MLDSVGRSIRNFMYRLFVIFIADWLIYLFALPVVWLLVVKREKALVLRTVLSFLIASFIGHVIKSFFFMPRPFMIGEREALARLLSDGSFPSNHSADTAAAALTIFFRYKKLGKILLLASFFVGLGRVLGGVHFVVDVLAGWAIGIGVAYVVTKLRLAERL